MTPSEQQKLEELHDYFLRPRAPGKPSRAEQIDDLLEAVRAGKLTARAVLWGAGAVVAILAAWKGLTSK